MGVRGKEKEMDLMGSLLWIKKTLKSLISGHCRDSEALFVYPLEFYREIESYFIVKIEKNDINKPFLSNSNCHNCIIVKYN